MPQFSKAMVVTQTTVSIPAGASTAVIAANNARTYLAIANIGTGNCNINFGAASVVDAGWPLDAASAAGRQGGGLIFGDGSLVHLGTVTAWSAAGTTLVVLEG